MSIVFTDNFTNSGSDTDINAWQSTEQSSGSADWAYHAPTSTTAVFRVDATTDKLVADTSAIGNGAGEDGLDHNNVVVINTVLSGVDDYIVAATLAYNNAFESSHLLARMQTGAYSGYRVRQQNGVAELHKMVAGVGTLIDSHSGGFAGSSWPASLQVSGSSITWSAGSMTPQTVTDATYSTGKAGCGMKSWHAVFGIPTPSEVFIDGFTVSADTPITFTPTANVLTITAPTVPAVHLTMPMTADVITITAPAIGLSTSINRKFPLVRTEMDAVSQFPNHVFPVVAYQDTSLIP